MDPTALRCFVECALFGQALALTTETEQAQLEADVAQTLALLFPDHEHESDFTLQVHEAFSQLSAVSRLPGAVSSKSGTAVYVPRAAKIASDPATERLQELVLLFNDAMYAPEPAVVPLHVSDLALLALDAPDAVPAAAAELCGLAPTAIVTLSPETVSDTDPRLFLHIATRLVLNSAAANLLQAAHGTAGSKPTSDHCFDLSALLSLIAPACDPDGSLHALWALLVAAAPSPAPPVPLLLMPTGECARPAGFSAQVRAASSRVLSEAQAQICLQDSLISAVAASLLAAAPLDARSSPPSRANKKPKGKGRKAAKSEAPSVPTAPVVILPACITDDIALPETTVGAAFALGAEFAAAFFPSRFPPGSPDAAVLLAATREIVASIPTGCYTSEVLELATEALEDADIHPSWVIAALLLGLPHWRRLVEEKAAAAAASRAASTRAASDAGRAMKRWLRAPEVVDVFSTAAGHLTCLQSTLSWLQFSADALPTVVLAPAPCQADALRSCALCFLHAAVTSAATSAIAEDVSPETSLDALFPMLAMLAEDADLAPLCASLLAAAGIAPPVPISGSHLTKGLLSSAAGGLLSAFPAKQSQDRIQVFVDAFDVAGIPAVIAAVADALTQPAATLTRPDAKSCKFAAFQLGAAVSKFLPATTVPPATAQLQADLAGLSAQLARRAGKAAAPPIPVSAIPALSVQELEALVDALGVLASDAATDAGAGAETI
jgi:hypothetical protein